MSGRLGMIGAASARGDKEIGKAAPKRVPFLHPKARAFDAGTAMARQGFNARRGDMAARMVRDDGSLRMRHAFEFGRTTAAGPQAPDRVKRALSGKDYGETIGRLGRATRRQNKEFSAVVHPLSGRILDMRRGNSGAVGYGVGAVASSTKSRARMARLADKAKNPEVRERATANLMGQNKHLVGPQGVLVHNHPSFKTHYGVKGRHGTRSYPSSQDRMVAGGIPGSRHVVLSHAPNGPGGRKTKAVTTRVVDAQRGISPGTHERLAHQDYATVTKPLRRALFKDKDVRRGIAAQVAESRKKAARTPDGKVMAYDAFHRQRTGNAKGARRSGLYTTESFHKVDTSMSDADAHRLAQRYDTRGPLPKTLSREQKMKAYEARYIAAGGRQGEKWKRRADRAEVGRNIGLTGATLAGAALLAHKAPGLRRVARHHLEHAAVAAGTFGGASELYGEHARSRRASYQNSPAGVAGSALTRMQAYTPTGRKS